MHLQPDHLVVNSHFELAATCEIFAALGFTLTPESHHTLGSSNRLVVFERHYLELIGVPREGKIQRQELLDSACGIDGLVFRSEDARATEQQLRAKGFRVQPVQDFSRATEANGERGEARFSTVRLAAGSFAAGRVYFCQHHTPEWVWRPPWLEHANGVSGIETLTLVTQQPEQERMQWQRLGCFRAPFALQILTHEAWLRFSAALLSLAPDRISQFTAISFYGGKREKIISAAQQSQLPCHRDAERLLIALPALQTLLVFRI